AVLNTTALPFGANQTITAVYQGSAAFIASASATLTGYSVGQAGTTVTTVSASPAFGDVFDQSVTLTATVAASAPSLANVTGGTVLFTDGAVTLGTGTLSGGIATLTTAALPFGAAQTITAVYQGSTNFAA